MRTKFVISPYITFQPSKFSFNFHRILYKTDKINCIFNDLDLYVKKYAFTTTRTFTLNLDKK